jgi:NAD(P)-dependent dehydrogenase (short-subunit alcohol dehydrogenase family)
LLDREQVWRALAPQQGGQTMSLAGANIVITGATSGLGLAVSKRFAQLGANTILIGRTETSAAAAVEAIEREVPAASLQPMVCDLASIASVDRLLADVGAQFATIDLLFNNAAVMKRARTLTDDGFEAMFQVNFLAPFILMTSLLDRVWASTMRMVLNNGRPANKLRVDFDDLQFAKRYRMYDSFFHTKLYLLLATLELAQRPEASGMRIHMAEPGPFKSELVKEAPWPVGWIKNRFSASVDDAADHIVYVAQSDAAQADTGKVFTKRDEVESTSYWQDADVRSRLWTTTEAMIERNRNAARK